MGYNLKGRKMSDTTEQLTLSLVFYYHFLYTIKLDI